MVNYSNGKIYKIEAVNAEPDEKVYVGSTTKEYLSQRMYFHKNHYHKWKDGKCDKVMCYDLFDKYGIDNCVIVLLEIVNCNSKDELLSKERQYYKTLHCINKHNPKVLDIDKEGFKERNNVYNKKYRMKNKDELNNKCKQYQKTHKDSLNETNKIKKNCICGSIHTKGGKSQHEKTIKHIEFMNKV
jgi:hypothetical protein